MTRGLRNNNPGNIRHSSTCWQGEVVSNEGVDGGDIEFKTFVSMAYGYRAMFKLLNTYSSKRECRTLRAMIMRWAPPTENNTEAYIAAVCLWTSLTAESLVDVTNHATMVALVSAISRMENGVAARGEDVEAGWQLYAKEFGL